MPKCPNWRPGDFKHCTGVGRFFYRINHLGSVYPRTSDQTGKSGNLKLRIYVPRNRYASRQWASYRSIKRFTMSKPSTFHFSEASYIHIRYWNIRSIATAPHKVNIGIVWNAHLPLLVHRYQPRNSNVLWASLLVLGSSAWLLLQNYWCFNGGSLSPTTKKNWRTWKSLGNSPVRAAWGFAYFVPIVSTPPYWSIYVV